MTRYQQNFIKVLEQVILNPQARNIDIVAAAKISDKDVTDLQFLAQKIVYKMKINNDSSKIAYYLRQLFKSPLFQPREMSSHDKHQWMQAKAIFREMQSMNESDKALKVGFTGWEDQQLEKYGLHTDNIHVQPDGTVLITETFKSINHEQRIGN
jgi:hypothetical protein